MYLLGHLKPFALTGFPTAARTVLPDEVADKILSLYSFDSASTDDEAFGCFLNYINDVGYYLATLAFGQGFSRPRSPGKGSSVFFFNHGNPWNGPFKGKASHVLDVAFLFQNYNHLLGAEQKKGSEDFAVDMMRFVSGEEVLGTSYEKEGRMMAMVYGDGGVKIADAKKGSDSGRRIEIIEVAEQVGGDKLMEVFERFMMSPGQ
jgi:hypothetical protein